jgi:hypothetical protein
MATKTRAMRTWGDLKLAMNVLVREGAIAGFRTNRDERGVAPAIWIKARAGGEMSNALQAASAVLTGAFEDTAVPAEAA